MTKNCLKCQTSFEITEDDLAFYDKVSPIIAGKKYLIPPPTLCPDCRVRRRLAFRNERSLYSRKCDFSQKDIISMYPAHVPFPVYHQDIWNSDQWDETTYGREFDFNRPFFEQYKELQQVVPRMALLNISNENSEYCNITGWSKNCYLIFATGYAEDSMYSRWLRWSHSCLDCIFAIKSELCYEIVWCENCYNLHWGQDCQNCHDGKFLYNCSNSNHCLFCAGLRNKQYCIWNKQYTKEQYEQELKQMDFSSHTFIEESKKKFKQFLLGIPRKNLQLENVENVTGDFIKTSKNIYQGFSVENCQDCRYLQDASELSDVMDCDDIADRCQLCQEVLMVEQAYNCQFILGAVGVSNLLYSDYCFNSSDSFGCTGLRRHRRYCILNKQYTKEEYETLVPKIIDHMRQTGEWGQFFPASLSPFGYNETTAQEYFPLTREQVVGNADLRSLQNRLNWSDYEAPAPVVAKVVTQEQMKKLPDTIKGIPDDILNWALTCEVTGKPYKIIKQELKFYRENNLPIPRRHPDQRHKERMALRNPRKLYDRTCMKCRKAMQTTYAPDRPEIVYCEECYLKEVY